MPLFKRKSTSTPEDKGHGHVVAWHRQRAVMAYVPLVLLTIFSTAVLWNHYDGVIQNDMYNLMAKVGLFVVDFIALGIATWHLFAKSALLAGYCFLAEIALTFLMCLHAGAVLELDAGRIVQTQRITAVGEAVAKITEAETAARIKAASQEAQRLNSIGQRHTAARLTRSAASVSGTDKAAQMIIEESNKAKPQSRIFSQAYMETGIYFVPVLIAMLIGMIAVGIAKIAEPLESRYNLTGPGGGNYLPAPNVAPTTVVAGFNPTNRPGQSPNNTTFFNQTGGEPPKGQSQ